MKKIASLFFLLVSLIALVSCTNKETLDGDLFNDIASSSDCINESTLKYQAKHYRVTYYDAFQTINHFTTYEQFTAFKDKELLVGYDEGFFKTHNLILIDHIENSGSNQVSVTEVSLNENNELVVTITRKIPQIGTCDMAQHKFIIAYEKPNFEVKNVLINYMTINM